MAQLHKQIKKQKPEMSQIHLTNIYKGFPHRSVGKKNLRCREPWFDS